MPRWYVRLQLDLLREDLASLFYCLFELMQLKLLRARNVRERILLLPASFQSPQVLPVAGVPLARGGLTLVPAVVVMRVVVMLVVVMLVVVMLVGFLSGLALVPKK